MKDNYILGLLYGDGHFSKKENYEWYMFSTTHKQLSIKVMDYLDKFNVKYFNYNRSFPKGHEKENYEILEIVEITDKDFIDFLVANDFKSEKAEERIKWNGDFIRGITETKGSLFTYECRGNPLWRISFSGNFEDMDYLKTQIEKELEISVGGPFKRREREFLGIISNSYRLAIQNRKGIKEFLSFIKGDNTSVYLSDAIKNFKKYDRETPFNMKRKVYKHYKYAVGFMAKELGLTIKGERSGGGKKGFKPVYLWNEDGEPVLGFAGWEKAYKWTCEIYQEQLGFIPPRVESDTQIKAVETVEYK